MAAFHCIGTAFGRVWGKAHEPRYTGRGCTSRNPPGPLTQPLAAPPRTTTESRPAPLWSAGAWPSSKGARGLTDKHHGVALLADVSEAPLLDIEEVRGLVSEGKERGFLTFEEISTTFE